MKGRIAACRWVRLACKRHLRDLDRAKHKSFPYRFAPKEAARACRFVELMPHVKGPLTGQPIVLEPWQVFIVASIFGWLVRATGLRRFRRVYIEVPRGNAKSTLLAAIGNLLVSCDGEGGAEVYSAATKKDQAKIVWGVAREMLRKVPDLCDHFGIDVRTHDILVPESGSKFVPLASDEDSLDGLNIHGGIIDELHAHKTRGVYDVLETGCGKRPQSILLVITTAGWDRAGICYEVRGYNLRVLEGVELERPVVVDDQVFAIVYTIDEGDDWTKEATWRKANPNWGISVEPSYVAGLARKAAQDARSLNNFLTKHLDVWVNAGVAWMNMVKWEACARTDLVIEDLKDAESIVGLDLASKIDLVSSVRVFRRDDGRKDGKPTFYVVGRHYVPEERANDVKDTYAGWVRDGRVIATPGNVVDFDQIRDDLVADASRFHTKEIAIDPWQATQLATQLQAAGATTVEVPQNVKNLSAAMKEIESLVMEGRLLHDGCPVLTWGMSNVICHEDAKENIFPRKERKENKIDPAVALITAMSRWLAEPPPPKPSVYEERGLLVL